MQHVFVWTVEGVVLLVTLSGLGVALLVLGAISLKGLWQRRRRQGRVE